VSILTDDRTGTAPSAGDRDAGEALDAALPPRRPALGAPVQIIQIYVVILVLIPPIYIIGPLGAVGTPATVLALGALVLWGIAVVTPGAYLCRTAVPVRVVMGLLIGTMFLSYALCHVHYVQGVELLASDRAMLQALSWVGISLLAAEGLRDRDEVYRVLRTAVAVVAIMAMVGLLQFRFGIDLAAWAGRIPGLHANTDLVSIQDRSGFRRPAGTATHPIEFGCVIAMVLPLALHMARFDLVRTATRRWLPLAAIAIGIPVAVSRSAVLAAVVAGVVIFFGLEPRLRPRAMGIAVVFILATYATTPGLLGTLRSLFVNFNSDTSISTRKSDYKVVGQYIRQSPWFGRGTGTFLSDVYIVLDNQYLMSAIEVGLVGLAVVIAYLLATAFLGRGVRHRSGEPAVRDLGQALAAGCVASAVATATFDAFAFRMFAGLIPLCLGLAGALWTMQRSGEPLVGIERSPEGDSPRRSDLVSRVDLPDPPVDEWRQEIVTYQVADVRDIAPAVAVALAPDNCDAGSVAEARRDAEDQSAISAVAGSSGPATPPEDIERDPDPPLGEEGEVADHGDRVHTHDLRQLFALAGAGIALLVLAILPFTIDHSDRAATIAEPEVGLPRRPTAPTSSTTTTSVTAARRPSSIGVAGSSSRTTRTTAPTGTSPTTAGTDRTLPEDTSTGTTAPGMTTTTTSPPQTTTTSPPQTTTTVPPTTTTTVPDTTTTTAPVSTAAAPTTTTTVPDTTTTTAATSMVDAPTTTAGVGDDITHVQKTEVG
jgi:O-antigen ligase